MNASTALIVIDVQNDFCPGGALAVPGGDEIVPLVNTLMGRFPLVVATQDWHPPGHASFASSHPGKNPFDTIVMGEGMQTLWPDHCVQGTPGAELHPALDPRPPALVLRKGMDPLVDSYSAFRDNDRRCVTGLHGYLQARSVRTLFLCGLATDYCVHYTAVDARELDYDVSIIIDACRAIDAPTGSAARRLDELRRAGVVIVNAGGFA